MGIAGECDSTTYYNLDIVFTIDKHYFNSNYYDIEYVEYVRYVTSLLCNGKIT